MLFRSIGAIVGAAALFGVAAGYLIHGRIERKRRETGLLSFHRRLLS